MTRRRRGRIRQRAWRLDSIRRSGNPRREATPAAFHAPQLRRTSGAARTTLRRGSPVLANRDFRFDRVVIGAHAAVRGVEKSGGRQGLNVGVNVAVIAPERLSQGTHAGDLVTA